MSAYSRTLANFTQPAVNGFVTVTVDASTDWMAAGQPVYCTNGGFYTAYNIPSDSTVILRNLGYDTNAAVGATIPTGSKISPSGTRGAAGSSAITAKVYSCATDPNGSVTASGPAVCIGVDGSFWVKTSTTNSNTGWTNIIAA